MIILNDCLVGNSRVPTKVNKNISTDLQEVGSDGKYTGTSKEVQTGSEILCAHFWTSQPQLFVIHIQHKYFIFRSARH